MPVTFQFGKASEFVANFKAAASITVGDVLYALNRQKSRILDRTMKGVDVNGAGFAPYSTNGPYYYYPGKASKNRSGAAGRFAKKVGGTKTRLGVKFASYAAFKASLGRSVVDLMGPSAPHMLQAIVVRVAGRTITDGFSPSGGDNRPIDGGVGAEAQGTIGIYGPEADRAEGHNTGAGHLPKREFFGFGAADEQAVVDDIATMQGARLDQLR